MPRPDPRPICEQRLAARRQTRTVSDRADARFSMIRGSVFVVAVVGCFFFAWPSNGAGIWLGLCIAAFAALVILHGRVVRELKRARAAVEHYEAAIDRLDETENRWVGKGSTGSRFASGAHPYSGDLDLFGPASMFERLSICRTPLGEECLADWLTAPKNRAEIIARQKEVEQLIPCVSLREELALLEGEPIEETEQLLDRRFLLEWARTPADSLPPWNRGLGYAISIAATITMVGWLGFAWPRVFFVACLFLLVLYLFSHRVRIRTALVQFERVGSGLHTLANVFRLIERGPGDEEQTPPAIERLREKMGTDPSAHRAILLLDNLTAGLRNSLQNQFFLPFSLLFCRPVHIADRLEHWRSQHGPHIRDWFESAGEFEALLSLAGYAFERHQDPFPQIAEDGLLFEATSLGHPLLPNTRCIRNEVRFDDERRLLLVSGSNMSGKSTLLRTVGLNAILAIAGAPVRAENLKMSVLQVGSAMRVQDSLSDGESFFYAVIRRMKSVIDLAEGDRPLLFLLDEILQGTNSHDRRVGAEGIIRSLLERPAIGFVTTHDLALTRIADSLGKTAENVHFEDRIENGQMIFDYQLRPGVVERSNALELMRLVGLNVPERTSEG